jgi:hypothetical protein
MSTSHCPNCNHLFSLDELKGPRCSACGHPIDTAITAEVPAPKERVWDRPLMRDISLARSAASADQMLAWASIRTSLRIFATGWILVHVANFFVKLLTEAAHRQGQGAASGLLLIQLLTYLALGAGVVLYVTGMAMSVAVPAEANLRGWAKGIIGGMCVSLLAFLAYFHSGTQLETERLFIVFAGAAFLAKLLYTRFLRGLAQHFHLPTVATAAEAYFWCEALFFVWAMAGLIQGTGRMAQAAPFEAGRQEWLALLAGLVLCVWFAGMVLTVRTTIIETLTGRRREPETPPGGESSASAPSEASQEPVPPASPPE